MNWREQLSERRSQALQRLTEPSVRERGLGVLRALKAARVRSREGSGLTKDLGLMEILQNADLIYNTSDTYNPDSLADTLKEGYWMISEKGEEYLQESETHLAEESRRQQAAEIASKAEQAMAHPLFRSHGLSLLRALKEGNASKGPAKFLGQWLVKWIKKNETNINDAHNLLRLITDARLISEVFVHDTAVGDFVVLAEGEKYLQEHET